MITSEQFSIFKVTDNTSVKEEDAVASEEPLEIRISYKNDNNEIVNVVSITMRTPGNDAELATGFLYTEGIISLSNSIYNIVENTEGNVVTFCIGDNFKPELKKLERNFYTTSSCGVCGKASLDAITTSIPEYGIEYKEIYIKTELIYSLKDKLILHQRTFRETGGLHASALFDLNGELLLLREDVGRHNALDKLIGAAFINKLIPLNNHILLLSGRASFELIQKAAMAGIKIVAAIGAPSSLAIKLATESGITLIGFLKNNKFNLYSSHQRVELKENN